MKIYTILGMIPRDKEKKSEYYFNENLLYSLKKSNYANMFELLLDNKDELKASEVVAIHTEDAKKAQEEVAINFTYFTYDDAYCIDDEKKFYKVLAVINRVLSSDGEIILDLSHGFRHLPILAVISLISKNLQGNKNIKHIFFAKEIEKSKKYEIIDLKEYLEIANLSIILENFSENYTISSGTCFANSTFQEISDNLETLSSHILANSFKQIYTGETLKNLLKLFEKLSSNKKLEGFNFEKSINHIQKLADIGNEELEYKKFAKLSKILASKGYLLNAITLLYEAIRYFCIEIIKSVSPEISKQINNFLQGNNSKRFYLTANFASKFIIHKTRKSKNNEIVESKFDECIKKAIEDNKAIMNFGSFVDKVSNFRNDLAHGNENLKIEDVRDTLKKYRKEFDSFCLKIDILKIKQE